METVVQGPLRSAGRRFLPAAFAKTPATERRHPFRLPPMCGYAAGANRRRDMLPRAPVRKATACREAALGALHFRRRHAEEKACAGETLPRPVRLS
jgi:hypothetical protein